MEIGYGDNYSRGPSGLYQPVIMSARWGIMKWNSIEDDLPASILLLHPKRFGKPVIEEYGVNLCVSAGLNKILDIFSGHFLDSGWSATSAYFANWSAYIGAGDSSVAAAAAQTDLQAATNKVRVAMDSTFPTSASSQVTRWQSSMTNSVANFVWNELALFNASSGGTMFARKQSSFGTKSSGVWSPYVDLTASSGTT